jgi:hypothetical protein
MIYSLMIFLWTFVIPARISEPSMWITQRNGHRYLVLKKNTGDRKAFRTKLKVYLGSV